MGILRFGFVGLKSILFVLLVFLGLNVILVQCASSVSRRDASNDPKSTHVLGEKSKKTVCELEGCKCSNLTWITVNCTFNSSQIVILEQGSVPTKLIEFFVTGGFELIIRSNTFLYLTAFNYLKLDGTKTVKSEKNAFHYNNSSTLFFEARNCDKLVIESNAFKNTHGPISATVKDCNEVVIHNSAFSRLLEGNFFNINSLELAEGAFIFENQFITQRHGPVGNITFHRVRLSNIPNNAFSSVISEVNFKSCQIDSIDSGAFNSTHISSVAFVESTIKKIASEAFTEKMLLTHFLISKCKVGTLQSKAVVAGGINNLTVQFSSFTDIQPGAINATVANIIITDNNIAQLKPEALIFKSWNVINLDSNHIRTVYKNFLKLPEFDRTSVKEFTFKSNYIIDPKEHSLNFVNSLAGINFIIDDNAFSQECMCFQNEWMQNLTESNDVGQILKTSFCNVTSILARCFEIDKSLMSMENFTILACSNEEYLKCEKYYGETKVIDTTATMFIDEIQEEGNSSMFILAVTLGSLLIIAFLGTLVILSIRAGLWLKRKGYCAHFRNLHYNHQNVSSHEDEGAMVTEEPPTINEDLPEELTQELLQNLRAQLENPQTHQHAREMIERLYEMFVIEDSYTNNNTQDDAHLYEELGNLQVTPHQHEEKELNTEHSGDAMNILKLIEDKINQPSNNVDNNEKKKDGAQPSLVNVYSEPQDSTVHLYSELNQKLNGDANLDDKKASLKSSNSRNIAFRPLPAKPNNEAGPSSLY